MGNSIHGYNFLLKIFQNLDYYDDIVSRERQLEPFGWQESEQKSFNNNKYILLAIKKSIEEYKTRDNNELTRFLKALDAYLEQFDKIENIKDGLTPIPQKLQHHGLSAYGEAGLLKGEWV